jgi:hypothetical protein
VDRTSGAIELEARPDAGPLPLEVVFDARGLPAGIPVDVDFEGDGIIDVRSVALNDLRHTYRNAGLFAACRHRPRWRQRDPQIVHARPCVRTAGSILAS